MPRVTYTLRIERPEEIDADTLAEIEAAAEPHDRTRAAKIGRWLGGLLQDAETMVSEQLPGGWYAVIEDEAHDA